MFEIEPSDMSRESRHVNMLRRLSTALLKIARGPSTAERIAKGKITVVKSAEGHRWAYSTTPLPRGFVEQNLVTVDEEPVVHHEGE